MIEHIERRAFALLLAFIMVFSMLPMQAFAATSVSLLDGKVTISATSVQGTMSDLVDGVVTVPAQPSYDSCSSSYSGTTSTVTFTNATSNQAVISFTYTKNSYVSSVTINGTADTTGAGSVTLAAGGTFTVALTGASDTESVAEIYLTGFKIVEQKQVTLTYGAAVNGSYTVNSTAATAGATLNVLTTDSVALAATPATGYSFAGWYNETTGSYFCFDANASVQFEDNATIVPKFIPTTDALFGIGDAVFASLDDALAAATYGSVIFPLKDVTLTKDYDIPVGITLLVPFDAANTCYTDADIKFTSYVAPSVYRTLTLADGVTLTVSGAISVSAKHFACDGASPTLGGAVSGKYGKIQLNGSSKIDVTAGGVLYAWGYVTGTGTVTVMSGGTVHELMQITDFRGGNGTAGLVGVDKDKKVFPFSQYYVQNVEAKEVLYAGAKLMTTASITASGDTTSMSVNFIGEGGMFQLESGTTVTKEYDAATDRLILNANGNVGLNGIALSFAGQNINSADFYLPINSNITINVNSGIATVNQDLVMLPGSVLNVAKGAQVYVPTGIEIFIYDADNWGNFVFNARKYTPLSYIASTGKASTRGTPGDAIVNINGTVGVVGSVYTSAAGAQITSTEGDGVFFHMAAAPTATTIYGCTANGSLISSGTFTSVAMNPADLRNGDGSVTATLGSAQYTGFVYNKATEKWEALANAVVTFDANGGTGEMAAQTYTFLNIAQGTKAALNANTFTKEGAVFQGWSTTADGDVEYTDQETVLFYRSTTLYAVWQDTEATVTYDANAPEGTTATGTVNPLTVDIAATGSATVKAAANGFTVEGYTFEAWNTKADGSGDVYAAGADITVTEDITLYAQWAKSTYTITFNANAPANTTATGTMSAQTVVSGDKLKANAFKIEGYTFKGWNTAADGSGASYADGASAPEANTTLYAVWEKNTYTITWLIDGVPAATSTVEHGETPVYPNGTPTKATEDGVKYTFTGWSPALAPATGDMEYEAQFSESTVSYSISWDTDGDGDVDKTTAVAHGTVPTAPAFSLADTAEWDYTFTGWKDSDGNEYTTLPAAYGDTTYTALYTSAKRTYTITWIVEGVSSTTTVAYGETPAYSGTPTKAEDDEYTYTFSGWSPAVTSVTGDATYTAQFSSEAKTYTITWNVDGTKTTQDVKYGTVITLPTEPSKTGHTFAGWSGYTAGMTMPAKNVEFTATWDVNQYTITWKVEGQEDVTQQVAYGTVPTYPNGTPAKAETAQYTYTFAGWTPEVAAVTGPATYTATFTSVLRKYDITFVVDGQEDVVVSTNYGETPVYPNGTPTKATDAYYAYTFAGWDVELASVTGEATYTATWTQTPVEHSITFVIDGEIFHQEKAGYGTTVDYSDMPSTDKIGYTFNGWDKELPESIPAEDVVITGSYTINQYTITYMNGDEVLKEIKADYNAVLDQAEIPADLTQEGYTFLGWSAELPATMPVGGMTISAQWKINQYTITYKNGDEVVATITEDYGTALDSTMVPGAPEKAGYTFIGWSAELPATMPVDGMTITAQWDANEYTISFYTEKDAETAHATITADTDTDLTEELAKIEAPTKDGYTFAGWVDADGNSVELSKMPADGMTVYAKWTTNEYVISFYATEGDTTAAATFDVPYGTELTEEYVASLLAQVTDPSKTGYTWNGWDTANVPAAMPAEAVNIYGTWNVNYYTVTFTDGDGNTIKSESLAYGAAVTAPEDPTKTGYTFAGWDAEVPATVPAENVTINATWTVNQYTITFDVEGIASITADYGTEITWPENPTKDGHTFLGWSTDGETVIELPETMPAENLNLIAVWARNTIYITWSIDGVETVEEYAYGDAITAPEATKAADAKWTYKFTGWDAEIPATATANATYTAIFAEDQAVQYAVKFVDGENTVYETQTAWNGEVTLDGFEAPTKDGHTLTWTVDGEEVTFPYAMTTEDVTFVAQWTPVNYSIEFYENINDEEPVHTITAPYGTEVSYDYTAPTGYTFQGWALKSDFSCSYELTTMPAENLQLVAINTPNMYKVTFISNGETVKEAQAQYGFEVSQFVDDVTAESIGEGYAFVGWFDENGVEYTEEYVQPAHDVTFTAKWTYTGWLTDDNGTTYLIEDEKAYFSEWADIGDATYYFDANGYIVKDITLIDGSYYAFDHDLGNFMGGYTGIYTANNGDLYYVENGIAVANKGLTKIVLDDGHIHYYYFGCGMDDCDSETCSGEYKAQRSGSHWAQIDNGYLVKWGYTFDAEGVIIHDEDTSKNGVHKDNGVKYYYIDGVKVHYGLFIGDDGEYYYARSDGSLVVSRDYWISASHLNGVERDGKPVEEGTYTFDSEGRIVWPTELKNGIYAEDGSLFYYVDGVRTYAGLINIDGDYYYVRGTGEVVNGTRYWITKTNDLMDQGSYEFDEEGKMVLTNGFVDVGDKTYYYVDGNPYHAGLIEVDGALYYVKSSGEVVKGCTYWISHTNGLAEEGSYEFDADGKMIIPEVVPAKNGIVAEDGSLYYYVDGVRTYAGLIEIDGDYYYVRGTGEVVHGRYYWITMTNGLMKQGGYNFDENGKMIIE